LPCILIIEDNPENLSLLERISQKLDCTIKSFTSPLKGLSWALENEFDLLVIDYHMPKLDGLDFIKKLRSTPGKETVPILMVSSEDKALLRPALEAGANDFLQKPLDRTEFLARAQNMLDLRNHDKKLRQHTENLAQEVHKATQKLKLTHERYRLASLASNDGFWDWNLEKNTIYYSDRWFEMLGFHPDDLPHTLDTWFSRVHKDDLKTLRNQLDQLIEGHLDILSQEIRLQHRTGEIIWVTIKSLTETNDVGKIIRLVGAQTDISERKRVEEQLARDALHDPLTGLPNRLLFNERFEQAFMRFKRDNNAHFAVLFIDIDRFKQVNDILGHAVGDTLLMTLSGRMKKCCREVDTVARLAGDEFVILLSAPHNVNDTLAIAQRLVTELNQPVFLDNQEIHPSASVGIAFSDTSYLSKGDMLRGADLALYQAKEKGRNQYCVFDVSKKAEMVKPLRYKSDLKQAVNKEEFIVYFQGIFDAVSEKLCGFEALARWQHPDLGTVLPKDFLLLAEESGKIAEIDRQIFEESIRQVARWRQQSGEDLFISFNLSTSALLNLSIKNDFQALAREHNLAPDKIVLELPEKIAHEGLAVASKTLDALKASGFRIALDDFGAGIASLHTLPGLPLDILKIDRSLVTDIHTNTRNQEMLKLIRLIIDNRGLDTIIEGVETQEELNFIRQNFQGMIQGYYFQKPVSANEIESLYPAFTGIKPQQNSIKR
tara:strand:- start:1441 stop:3591 length:2151 start_codon:yes stop_codon:yes gene_type:complete